MHLDPRILGAYLTLCIVYIVLFLFSIVIILRRRVFTWYRKNSWLFISSYIVVVLLRAGYFLSETGLLPCVPSNLKYFLLTGPSFWQFNTYMGLVLLWSDIYMSTYDVVYTSPLLQAGSQRVSPHRKKLSHIVYMFVGVATLLFILFYAAMWSTSPWNNCDEAFLNGDVWQKIYLSADCTIYLATAPVILGFWIYGYRIFKQLYYEKMGSLTSHEFTDRNFLLKFAVLLVICVVCFITRAVLVIIQNWKTLFESTPYTDVIYYMSLEVFPLVMMISVLISSIINTRKGDLGIWE